MRSALAACPARSAVSAWRKFASNVVLGFGFMPIPIPRDQISGLHYAQVFYIVSTLYILIGAVMRVVVKKWGNSASIRIPAAIMQASRLELDNAVDVREEGGRIVIEPIRADQYDLKRLLAGITPENLHTEIQFGAPVGKEQL